MTQRVDRVYHDAMVSHCCVWKLGGKKLSGDMLLCCCVWEADVSAVLCVSRG